MWDLRARTRNPAWTISPPSVSPVQPFGACFRAKAISHTRARFPAFSLCRGCHPQIASKST